MMQKEEIDSNQNPSNRAAYLMAIKLLSRRDYSTAKLRKKLEKHSFSNQEIESSLEAVIQKGYLNEEAFIKTRIKIHMQKGHSPELILRKLEHEQLVSSINFVKNFFEEHGINETLQIRSLIKKRVRVLSQNGNRDLNSQDKLKILKFLYSRGHSISTSQSILKDYFI